MFIPRLGASIVNKLCKYVKLNTLNHGKNIDVQDEPLASSSLMKGLKGFTLIEMLVVLSIFAIMAAVATPTIQRTLAEQRIRNAAYNLKTSIEEARGEAVGSRRVVELWSAYGTSANPWNGPKSGTVKAPNGIDSGRLANMKLSWYVIKPGPVASGIVANLTNSENNTYPVQVSLSDSVQISSSLAAVNGDFALRFSPFGAVTRLDGTLAGQVVFRVCDSRTNNERGYTIIMNPQGGARVVAGPVVAAGAIGSQTCA